MKRDQLVLNLRPMAVDDGKKTQRLATTCSDDLQDMVDKVAQIRKTTRSELIYEYIIDGLKADVANIFMPAPHLDKTLRELLAKKF